MNEQYPWPAQVLTGFDGASPHHPQAVTRIGPASFVLQANYRQRPGESEDAGDDRGARFETRVINHTHQPLPATIAVDWAGPRWIEHRDIGFVRHNRRNSWWEITGVIQGNQVIYQLDLPPGMTELSLYPAYNVSQCQRFVAWCQRQGAGVKVAGFSEQKRPIWLVHVPSTNPHAHNLLVRARDHAYETASSFAVEGMLKSLLNPKSMHSAKSQAIRSQCNVWVLPMTNPDGVYNGMSRLTHENGADLNRLLTQPDAAHHVMRSVTDKLKPAVQISLHNWQPKDIDGLLCNEPQVAAQILERWPADEAHGKRWFVETLPEYLASQNIITVPDQDKSWKDYCLEHFDCMAVTLEFPWHRMTPVSMRTKGQKALQVVVDTAACLEKFNVARSI